MAEPDVSKIISDATKKTTKRTTTKKKGSKYPIKEAPTDVFVRLNIECKYETRERIQKLARITGLKQKHLVQQILEDALTEAENELNINFDEIP